MHYLGGLKILLEFDVHEPVVSLVFNTNSLFVQAFGKAKVLILESCGVWTNF